MQMSAAFGVHVAVVFFQKDNILDSLGLLYKFYSIIFQISVSGKFLAIPYAPLLENLALLLILIRF